MSRILCVGDLHLNHSRLQLCQDVLKWIEKVSIENSIDSIVYLGDEHDSHSVIRAECNNIWTQHLVSQLKLNIPIYWLCGNHAQFKSNDATHNALQPFIPWKGNLHPIVKPSEIDGLGFVPYLNNISWKDATSDFSSKIIFTHNTFVGSDFGFKIADGGILLSDITSDIVISGHIHKRQTLGDAATATVEYPGTPYSWSAHDVDQVKGVMIVDSNTYKKTFIESPFPLWRKIEANLNESLDVNIPLNIKSKDHLLVKLIGNRSDIKAYISSGAIDELRKKYCSVSISTEFLNSAKAQGSSIKSTSIDTIVEEYMDKFYKGGAPIDEVKKIILEALGNKT